MKLPGPPHFLIVDLDGSLIRSDSLHDSFAVLFRKNPFLFFAAFRLLLTTFSRREAFKSWVANHAIPDPALLPYNEKVIELIQKHRSLGGQTILATAAHYKIAKAVYDHLGIFDSFIATDESSNLKGKIKLEAIVKAVHGQDFTYIGDSEHDLPIWNESKGAVVVGSKGRLVSQLRDNGKLVGYLPGLSSQVKHLIKSIRPHQWVKNILISIPLLAAHRFDLSTLSSVALAFSSFSAVASAIYLVNDFCDLEADRAHPKKKYRPLADGRLSIELAALSIFVLLAIGFTIASFLSISFFTVLSLYFILTCFYSFSWKRLALFDIFALSALYIIRLIAGHAATRIPMSSWLIAFCLFLFLSLASVKRCSELLLLVERKQIETIGRGYVTSDLQMLPVMGVASGFCAVLVFTFYINSHEVIRLYQSPFLLWLVSPLILMWICRTWFLTFRGKIHEDPIVFAIKDPFTYIIGGLSGAVMLAACHLSLSMQ